MPKCDCPSAGVPTFDCVRCGARGTASPRPSGETPAPPAQVTPEAKSQSAAVTRESAASGSTLSPAECNCPHPSSCNHAETCILSFRAMRQPPAPQVPVARCGDTGPDRFCDLSVGHGGGHCTTTEAAPQVPVGERKPIEHDLKVAPEFFDALASGAKRFELRRADRDFRVWDTLRLREWEGDYTGREHRAFVTYVLSEGPWLAPGYACLGIAPLPALRSPSPGEALDLARLFHDTYERLAPSFGYETRKDTRTFDPTTPNGRLMVVVCGEVLAALASPAARREDFERAKHLYMGAAIRRIEAGGYSPEAHAAVTEADRLLGLTTEDA
jgi:hypothetical protein